MRRKLNRKFLVLLLAVLILPCVGVHFLHAFQVNRQASALLDQARRYKAEGDYDKAADYLGRYLHHKPDVTEVLEEYADLLERQSQSVANQMRAYEVLEQVVRRLPDRRDLRRRVVKLSMGLMQYQRLRSPMITTATDHLQYLLKVEADSGDLLFQLGQCQEAAGNIPSAIESYSKAMKLAPKELSAYVRLAVLLRREMKEISRADQVMKDMVDRNRDSWEAWVKRARYRREFRTASDDALADVDRAFTLAPNEADVLLIAGQVHRDKNNLKEARKYLQAGVDKYPDHVLLHQELTNLEIGVGDRGKALEVLAEGLQNKPNDPLMLMQQAEILVQENRVEEARLVIQKMRGLNLRIGPLLDYLEARILASKLDWQKAVRALEQVRPQLNTVADIAPAVGPQADLLMAMCYRQLADAERMIQAYRRAITGNPQSPTARYQLAGALTQMGRLQEAADECRRLNELPDSKSGWWTLSARIQLLQNLRLPPAKRKWEAAIRDLNRAEKLEPDSQDVAFLRAEVFAAQEKFDEARVLLEQARDKHPEQIGTWSALINLVERSKGPEPALALLDQAQKRLGDSADVRLLRIRYWSKRRGPEAEKAITDLASDLTRYGGGDQLRLRAALAEAYVAHKKLPQAKETLSELVKEQPENLALRVVLLELLRQTGGTEAQMQPLQHDIRRLEGEEGVLWRYNEAAQILSQMRAGETRRIPEARTRLAEVTARRPNWSKVPLLEGDLYWMEGDQTKALESYQKAIELGESQPSLVARTIALLNDRKRYDAADKLLSSLRQRVELPPEIGRLAAEAALQTGDKERALQLARQTVSPRTKDYRELLWLSQFLTPLGRREEARQTLERALELGGKSREAWLALIEFYVRTDQKDRAEATLQQARTSLPPDEGTVAVALGYDMIGQSILAEHQFRAAAAAKPEDPTTLSYVAMFFLRRDQFPNAEPHLRKLLSLKSTPPEMVDWARRRLALGLAGMEGHSRFQEAIALIDQNLRATKTAGDPRGVEDMRAKARILSTRPRHLDEAVALMEQTWNQAALQAEDLLLLARLYRAQRAWPKERQQLLNLLGMQPQSVNFLVMYVNALLQHGEKEEAQVWLDKLEKLEPRSFPTTALKARTLHARGRKDEARALLRSYAVAGDVDQYVAIATVLEQIDQLADAEDLLRRSANHPKYADTMLNLIAFLVRHKKLAEGLELLDKAWDSYRPELVANVSLSILSQAPLSPQQWQRVQQRVEGALKKAPQNITLLSCLAMIYDFHQNTPTEAIRVYEQILQIVPSNVMAQNNVAILLSLHGGKHSDGLDLVGKAIETAGPEAALLDTRGLIQLKAGRPDLALEDMEKAVAAGPTPYHYFHLAEARLAKQNRQGAKEAMDKANSLGLVPELIHPLERADYRRVVAELFKR